jgi:hypothetical protein
VSLLCLRTSAFLPLGFRTSSCVQVPVLECDGPVCATPIDRSCSSTLQNKWTKETPKTKTMTVLVVSTVTRALTSYALHSRSVALYWLGYMHGPSIPSGRCQSHVRRSDDGPLSPAVTLMTLDMPNSGGPTDNSLQGWLLAIVWELNNSAKRDQRT